MATLKVQRPKGTQDVVPSQMYKWNTVEGIVKDTASAYGFREIRIPTFEDTALFVRSVGDTTDVVQKEMYSVTAKGDADFTLRPEGTAGTIRALIENGILNEGFPQKVFYVLSCFRHEKPQAGRLREFHQFGVEMAGTKDPRADAEVISLAKSIIDTAGLRGIKLFINSIGCPECRAKYHAALKEYFAGRADELCDTCRGRLEKNPMRILDCKSPVCSEIAEGAPVILDYLCEDCREHFEKLQQYLTAMDIKFEINPKIVRGLDYYTKTVFEFVTTDIGAQGTVCGGGRYDGLIETLSGKPCPALGFAMGLERLILTMEKQGLDFAAEDTCDIYIASMGEAASVKAMQMCAELRADGVSAECDVVGRGLKAQMKYADKLDAKFSVVLGDSELESQTAELKNMQTGEKVTLPIDERFKAAFNAMLISHMLSAEEIEEPFDELESGDITD
ncbi:histidine--tRNA ligase [Ruminococcus sp. CAG:579]|nr:histidine--tRNA ligase [Ruminococcus sp. CAG:579]